MMPHTDSEADLLLLIGQSIVIVEVKLQAFVLAGQQLPLQAKQNTEVAFTAHQPDGVTRGLQVNSHLRYKTRTAYQGLIIKYQYPKCRRQLIGMQPLSVLLFLY